MLDSTFPLDCDAFSMKKKKKRRKKESEVGHYFIFVYNALINILTFINHLCCYFVSSNLCT